MRTHPDLFWVRVENSDGLACLRLTGRLDAAALVYLGGKIDDARGQDVVLDLGGITFVDDPAWLAVTSFEHRVCGWGGRLQLVHAQGAIRERFESPETEHLLPERGRR